MQPKIPRHARWKVKVGVVALILIAAYVLILPNFHHKPVVPVEDYIDMNEVERQADEDKPVKVISYKEIIEKYDNNVNAPLGKSSRGEDRDTRMPYGNTMELHKVWAWVDKVIHRFELFPNTKDVDRVLKAMTTAKIVHVDILDIGIYESGTSEKWAIMLEGGQRAMMKLIW